MKKKSQIYIYIAKTLDGFIADKNGGVEFLSKYQGLKKLEKNHKNFFDKIDTVLLGSKTYEQVLKFDCEWPYKNKETYVITSRNFDHPKETIKSNNNPKELLSRLKNENKNVWVDGGSKLINYLIENNLIDRYILI
jgi:dihydrofolate reductase